MIHTLLQYITAYKNKITNKLWGVVFLYTKKKKKGTVLIAYITGPFTLAPGEYFTDPHSNYWVTAEMARIFLERGYDVDVINWNNVAYKPRKHYACVLDIDKNLEGWKPFLSKDCVKIYFINGSYWKFQNEAEQKRLLALQKRRGVLLSSHRNVSFSKNTELADFIAGYGNSTVHGTFPVPEGKIIPLPVPAMDTYDFPENKDFEKARTHFLWFGGGGAMLKGLDLVLEAFAALPHLKLSIIGPAAFEKEFEETYAKELALPNIIRYSRPKIQKDGTITTDGIDIRDILNQCGAVVYVSASEGGGGAVVHAMQAGIFPIVSPNTGISEKAPSKVLSGPTIENIHAAVQEFSQLSPEKIKQLSKEVWRFAQKYHTKKSFTEAFENLVDNIVKLK
ncbi:MAG: glycosyltransferase [Patescibacteria group bacterium]|nr:glycosyltransferase [bacterium]MDZ4240713.1 glycosyltransferase [Patescibacteria group bacterium]